MDNFRSASNGGETPSTEPLRAKKVSPVIDEPLPGADKYKAFGLTGAQAQERPAAGPRNVRAVREGAVRATPAGQNKKTSTASAALKPVVPSKARAGSTHAGEASARQRPSSRPAALRPVATRDPREPARPVKSARPVERPASRPSPNKPINLREAKEGLTLAPVLRPEKRPASAPSSAKPVHRPETVARHASAPLTRPKKRPAVESAQTKPRSAPKARENAVKNTTTARPLSAKPRQASASASTQANAKDKGKAESAVPQVAEAVREKTLEPVASSEKSVAPREPSPAPAAAPVAEGPKCDLYPAQKVPVLTLISYTLLVIVLFAGWFYSGDEVLTAKEGTGYIIGIVGGAMMLLLVLYPLRKTSRFMRRMGAVKHWFRAHMILGLIGPALILYHANFSFGSLNSSVALSAMLLVALSGLVGRYIYAGIHYGLYGKEMSLVELRKDFEDKSHGMTYVLDYAPAVRERLVKFGAKALKPRHSFVGSIAGLVMTLISAMRLRLVLFFALGRTLRVAAKRNKWSSAEIKAQGRAARLYVANHIGAAMAIARFKVYERLFSLWHILHMPLFLMLVLTAIIHVIAVHMF